MARPMRAERFIRPLSFEAGVLGAGAAVCSAILTGLLAACGGASEPGPVIAGELGDLDLEIAALIESRAEDVRSARGDARAHARLGLVYAANLLWSEARASFANAARLEPGEPLWIHRVALCLYRGGEPSTALDMLRGPSAIHSGFAPLQHLFGELALEAGEFDEALAAYDRVRLAEPERCEGFVGRGEVLCNRGDYALAVADLEQAVRLDPDYRVAHFLLGTAYRGLGRLDAAQRELRLGAGGDRTKRILPDELDAESEVLSVGKVTRMMSLRSHMRAQRWPEALAETAALLTYHPDDEKILVDHAICLVSLGRRDEALVSLRHLERIDPDSYLLRLNFTQFLLEGGNAQEALRNARRAVTLEPEKAQAHAVLARALLANAKPRRARKSFLRAHELAPANVQFLELLARADLELRDYTAAQERFEKLAALRPKSPTAWLRVAEASYGAGDHAAARRALTTAEGLGASRETVERLGALLDQADR